MSENPPAAGPPATEEKQSLRYDNILLTRRGIAEIHGRKVVIFIPAADIKSITLKYGRPEHRPIISLTIGAIFAIIGILGLVDFFFAMAAFRYELGAIAFGVIGASIIYDVLKQRFFLEVQSPKGPRRLVLSKHAQKNGLQTFCDDARKIYQHDITYAISTAG